MSWAPAGGGTRAEKISIPKTSLPALFIPISSCTAPARLRVTDTEPTQFGKGVSIGQWPKYGFRNAEWGGSGQGAQALRSPDQRRPGPGRPTGGDVAGGAGQKESSDLGVGNDRQQIPISEDPISPRSASDSCLGLTDV